MGNVIPRHQRERSTARGRISRVNITDANALGPSSIQVTWDKVPDPHPDNPIKTYTISYSPGVNCSCRLTKTVNGRTFTTTITNLNDTTTYCICASASTDSHNGPMGKTVKSTTLPRFSGPEDGDVYRLWSYQCRSLDRYVCMTGTASGTAGYVVDASGVVQGTNTAPFTKITFVQQSGTLEPFILQFNRNSTAYSMKATISGVIATTNINDATHFLQMHLLDPNNSYYVLKKADEDLYLSSDGAGDMKLKQLNDVLYPPPDTTEEIDPALLFRFVAIET